MDKKSTITIERLLKLILDLNTYIIRINQQLTLGDNNSFKVTIIIVATTLDYQMVIIVAHVGKNMADDVLLDGNSEVNVIMNGLKWKLGLLPHRLTLFNLKMVVNYIFLEGVTDRKRRHY